MDIRDLSCEALVLSSRDYREQDRLLTIVTPKSGPEKVIARGARKPEGSLRPLAQPFTRSHMTLSPAKGGLRFLKEGRPEESYLSLNDGLASFAYATYLSELALIAWPSGQAAPELYYLLLAVLTLLKMGNQPQPIARWFEARLLKILGWLPDLEICAGCGSRVIGRSFLLSPRRGALLCAACGQSDPAPLLSAGSVLSLRRLASLPPSKLSSLRLSPAQLQELENALAHNLTYHLETAGQARKVLEQLTKV